jgi:hypothetical protein
LAAVFSRIQVERTRSVIGEHFSLEHFPLSEILQRTIAGEKNERT